MPEGDAFRVTFAVPGIARGKGAGRVGNIGGRPRMFTDSRTRAEMADVRKIAFEAMDGRPPYEGPVVLRACAYMGMPDSWSDKKRARGEAGDLVPSKRPDADNFLKLLGDGLNQVVWRDDAQVVTAIIHKRYSLRPRLSIDVRSAEQQAG
jgi:Holliday junction resolvase RusA-like endonuclease